MFLLILAVVFLVYFLYDTKIRFIRLRLTYKENIVKKSFENL